MITTLLSSETSSPSKFSRRGLSHFVSSIKSKKSSLPTSSHAHPYDADNNIQQGHTGSYSPKRLSDFDERDLPPPPPPKDAELGYLPRTTKPRSYTVSGHESGYHPHAQNHHHQPGPVQASKSSHTYTSSQDSTFTPTSTSSHHQYQQNQHQHQTPSPIEHSRIPRYTHTHSRGQTSPSPDMLAPTALITPMNTSFPPSSSFHVVPRPAQDTPVIRPLLPPAPRTPHERAQLRLEIQRAREAEDLAIMREEAERQARIKAEKAELLRREAEDAEARKAHLNKEVQLALAKRQRMEYFQKAEEENASRLLEERQALEKQKRLEEGRRQEEWRRLQAFKAEEARRAQERAQLEEIEERKSKLKEAKEDLKRTKDPVTSGWVTIQLGQTLIWRRRFFKLIGTGLMLYKSADAADIAHGALDTLELDVARFCEWSDGYEELRAIPHSFAVEFKDGNVWSMFTDTENEKFMLLALLQQAARV